MHPNGWRVSYARMDSKEGAIANQEQGKARRGLTDKGGQGSMVCAWSFNPNPDRANANYPMTKQKLKIDRGEAQRKGLRDAAKGCAHIPGTFVPNDHIAAGFALPRTSQWSAGRGT